jgi:CubicO group peptidase (beta-lactamase class C family)
MSLCRLLSDAFGRVSNPFKPWKHSFHPGDDMTKMATSSPKLQDLSSSITEIMRVSGTAGTSIGVLDGETGEIHLAGLGHRDIDAQLPPDEHTIYHLASLSKSFTAAAIGILVADGKLNFGDRMCDVLSSFHHHDENVAAQSTVLDFLSHRTGIATKNAI